MLREYGLEDTTAVGGNTISEDAAALVVTIRSSEPNYHVFITGLTEPSGLLPLDGKLQPGHAISPGDNPIVSIDHEFDFASYMAVALFLIAERDPETALIIIESTAGNIPGEADDDSSSNRAIHAFISALASSAMDRHIDALKAYSQAIRLEPDFTNAYINRGSVYLEAGDETTALSTFIRAADAGVIDEGYLAFNMALAYIEEGDYATASRYANDARHLLGDIPMAISLSGLTASLNDNYETALDLYSELVSLLPGDPVALANLGITQSALMLHNEALETFSTLVKTRGLASDYVYLAEVYRLLGENIQAADALSEALMLKPDDLGLLVTRGRLYLESGDIDSSRADVDAVLKINPEDGEATFLLGDILFSEEAWNDARNAYIKAESLGIEEAALFAHRGWASHMLRMTQAATADYQKALDRDFSDPALLYWLGIALFDSGYSADSLEILFAAVNALDNAEVNAALALSLDANVRRDEADQAYQRAIDLDERFSDPEYLRTLTLWNELSIARAQNILRRLGYLE